MGLSGVRDELVDAPRAKAAGVDLIRRFTGGGTVVTDDRTFFSSLVLQSGEGVPKHPREIMAWTAEFYSRAFSPLFPGGTHESSSCNAVDAAGPNVEGAGGEDADLVALRERASARGYRSSAEGRSGPFWLSEHDYCFGEQKVGGNAQTITRGRFVHHTSFLTAMDPRLMDVLALPKKRPAYRGDRGHADFLTTASAEAGRDILPGEMAAAVAEGLGMWFDGVEEVPEGEAWEAAGMTPQEAEALLGVPLDERPKKPFDRRIRTVREAL